MCSHQTRNTTPSWSASWMPRTAGTIYGKFCAPTGNKLMHCRAQHGKTKSLKSTCLDDLLCNVYGLCGAAGIYTRAFGVTPQRQNCRSPTKLSHMWMPVIEEVWRETTFKREGKNRKKAAKYNNVVESPIFHIELDHVCPTYLHIVLGIVKKHHSLLEEQCHQLDQKIAKHLAQGNDPEPDKKTHFSMHVSSLRRMQTNPSDQQLQFRTGPVAQELDTGLKKT